MPHRLKKLLVVIVAVAAGGLSAAPAQAITRTEASAALSVGSSAAHSAAGPLRRYGPFTSFTSCQRSAGNLSFHGYITSNCAKSGAYWYYYAYYP